MSKNLTEQEKFQFAKNIYSDVCKKNLRYGKKQVITGCVIGFLWVVAICVATIVLPYMPSLIYPMAIFGAGYSTVVAVARGYKVLKQTVKDASCGKIDYWEYKRLVKSGELEQWAKGCTNAETAQSQSVQAVAQDNGVQLSAEEVAVLKKLMEKQGISNADCLSEGAYTQSNNETN